MNIKNFDKTTWSWLIILAILIVVLLIPIQLPYRITVPGKVLPAKEWLLYKDTEGRLMTSLINHKSGVHESYSVRSFQRGDAIQFSLNPNIFAGASVTKSDTVGVIYSNETEKQLVNLKASLLSQTALLDVNKSTEKEALISEAKQGVAFAERQFVEQQKIYYRQKGLFDKELISEQEFDLSKGALELFRINIEIAKERLNSVTTGEKQEQIDLVLTNINGLQNEIGILEQRFSNYIIQSPINGTVNRVFSSDTLLIVSDTTEYVVYMPVQWNYKEHVKKDQTVEFDMQDRSPAFGKIIAIENSAELIDQNIVSLTTATYSGNNSNFVPGLLLECSIICDDLTPRQHLFRFLESLLN